MTENWPKRFPFVCLYHPWRPEGYIELSPSGNGYFVGYYCRDAPDSLGRKYWHHWSKICSALEGEALMAGLSRFTEEKY